MYRRSESGFTLVETIIVMAISSALAVIALMGFSILRGQAQFSDSVERLKESILSKRQEALSTIKLSGGTDPNNVTFGRVLTFQRNSSVVTVQTLRTANYTTGSTPPTAGQAVNVVAAENTSFTIPWGVTYDGFGPSRTGTYVQVAFVRSTVDGRLQTAVSPVNGWPGRTTGNYTYGNFTPGASAQLLNFVDPASRRATVTVDPTNNGVTRAFP